MGDPSRIDARGFVILIDQRFEVAHGAVGFRAGQGRGQVVDDHRLGAAFGLGAFARVVDDEGVYMGHRAKDGLGQAGVR